MVHSAQRFLLGPSSSYKQPAMIRNEWSTRVIQKLDYIEVPLAPRIMPCVSVCPHFVYRHSQLSPLRSLPQLLQPHHSFSVGASRPLLSAPGGKT